MIIGIDVGGTHTDGVLMQRGKVVAKKKVGVDHDRLGDSIISLLEYLLPENRNAVHRIHLSTTLCTNAIVNNNFDRVAMFVQAGPGMNPDFLDCGEHLYFLSGAVDHRGQIVKDPLEYEVQRALEEMEGKGITSAGIVTKFSHRNNEHEMWVSDKLVSTFSHISMGHRLSGMPNFPRRVYTTWLNSALKTRFHEFKEAIEKGILELGVSCPVYILKADGGTMPFIKGCDLPCQSIHSGPSASVMGALALVEDMDEDCILLDIGGTTTDISIFSEGIPLLEPYGATVAGRPTLIRALLTKSVGLGGDSAVVYDGGYTIGPEKQGAPMAFGGGAPTPTDAMVVLGTINEGSMEEGRRAMMMLRPDGDPETTANELLRHFVECVFARVEEMMEVVFSRPVYTVSDFLDRRKLEPQKIIILGGPAAALRGILENRFGLTCQVPDNYEVANAIGSARARLTLEASLYADTGLGRLTIPEMSLTEKPGRMFTLKEAEVHLEETIKAMALEMGMKNIPKIDFIERLEMNTVRGFSTTGKILSLKAQIRPGLSPVEE